MTAPPDDRSALRGDEEELFERYEARLRERTAHSINTTRENIEDACALAWMRLVRNQPRRETVFAWLETVARNEALRLDRAERSLGMVELSDEVASNARDPRDPIAAREALLEVRERLEPLDDRGRAAMLLRGLGWTYAEAGARLGVSTRRLDQILVRSHEKLDRSKLEAELAQPDAHPRARLLAELQKNPPPFLRAAIGRPPSANHKDGGVERRLEWSRVALAIVDHRVQRGIFDPAHALGREPGDASDEARTLVEGRIVTYNEGRARRRETGRGIDR